MPLEVALEGLKNKRTAVEHPAGIGNRNALVRLVSERFAQRLGNGCELACGIVQNG